MKNDEMVPVKNLQPKTFDSTDYWQNRYRVGGNSGSGSYGRLAVYKAHEINRLVHQNKIRSVMELGSGDGANTSLYAIRNYTGVDVSEEVVMRCRENFADKTDWRFDTLGNFTQTDDCFPMTMSLDVIYHLVEDDVFCDYMTLLFSRAKKWVLIYSSDHDEQAPSEHVRHRKYSRWIEENQPCWTLAQSMLQPFPRTSKTNPRHTSFAFFQLYRFDL